MRRSSTGSRRERSPSRAASKKKATPKAGQNGSSGGGGGEAAASAAAPLAVADEPGPSVVGASHGSHSSSLPQLDISANGGGGGGSSSSSINGNGLPIAALGLNNNGTSELNGSVSEAEPTDRINSSRVLVAKVVGAHTEYDSDRTANGDGGGDDDDDDDDDEYGAVPLYESVGRIPDEPPDLPIGRRLYQPANVVSAVDAQTLQENLKRQEKEVQEKERALKQQQDFKRQMAAARRASGVKRDMSFEGEFTERQVAGLQSNRPAARELAAMASKPAQKPQAAPSPPAANGKEASRRRGSMTRLSSTPGHGDDAGSSSLDDDGGSTTQRGGGSTQRGGGSTYRGGGGSSSSSAKGGGGAHSTNDTRKVIDDFKKPIEDTRTLIDDFVTRQTKGAEAVPSVVAVAHVEAMRESIKSLRCAVMDASERLSAIQARFGDGGGGAPFDVASLDRAARARYVTQSADVEAELRRSRSELASLQKNHATRRDDVLERTSAELLPLLDHYERTYEDLLKSKGERDALDELALLCKQFTPEALDEREEPLPKQPADLGPPHLTRTLLSLAERADTASRSGGSFERLAREASKAGGPSCYVEHGPLKGFKRAMEKAHAEYGGDYLRLNDYVRCSLIAPSLSSLCSCARWLVEEARPASSLDETLPDFEVLLVKDRLSPDFDAEAAGMYRHLLVVGRMQLASGKFLNVEIVLTAKRLFEAKKRLHILFEGRRSCGASEVGEYVGELSLDALNRCSRGIVTQLRCADHDGKQHEIVAPPCVDALRAVLQRAPCGLTVLDLTNAAGFATVELGAGLLLPSPTGGAAATGGGATSALACHRLREVRLSGMKLAGAIPPALSRCVWMHTLELHDNQLSGPLPEELGRLIHLETLALHGNELSGEAPAEALLAFKKLGTLTLGGDLGGNSELSITRAAVRAIEEQCPEAEICWPDQITNERKSAPVAAAADESEEDNDGFATERPD